MKLTESDIQNPLWTKLKKHMEERLQNLRIENDKDIGESQTNRIRGAIKEIKNLIAMDKPEPKKDS